MKKHNIFLAIAALAAIAMTQISLSVEAQQSNKHQAAMAETPSNHRHANGCDACSHSCHAMPVAPRALKPGDTIAIISPASAPKAGVAEAGAKVLREWGFNVMMGKNIYSTHGMYAGTTQQRLDDLMAALRNPAVKAIMCTRGGYGSSLLLNYIPLDTLRRYPKWIIGYSDITSLHSAQVKAGNMSLHANMCGALKDRGASDPISLMLRDVLMGKYPDYDVPAHPLNHYGTASGILVGGNMAVFSNLAGSADYDFLDRDFVKGRDIILFFEDVSESMPRVMSMLNLLKLKGVMSHVKGIVVGRFTDYDHPAYGYNDIPTLLDEYLAGYNIPICYDFPASHDESWNYPMIEGCQVKLEVTSQGTQLTFLK